MDVLPNFNLRVLPGGKEYLAVFDFSSTAPIKGTNHLHPSAVHDNVPVRCNLEEDVGVAIDGVAGPLIVDYQFPIRQLGQ